MISYNRNDVKVWREGWTVPRKMTEDLFKEFHSIVNTDLRVFREIETANERTVVNKDITSQLIGLGHSFKGALESVAGKGVEAGAAGVYSIGSSIGLCESSNTPPPNNDAPPFKSETDTPSSNNDTEDLPVD